MKYIVIVSAMLLSVGCASTSDLNHLSTRVDALNARMTASEQREETLNSNQEALKSDVSDINAKFDRMVAKGRK